MPPTELVFFSATGCSSMIRKRTATKKRTHGKTRDVLTILDRMTGSDPELRRMSVLMFVSRITAR